MPPGETNFQSDDKAAIVCLHCGKAQEVGRKAMTITCKFCNKSLKLEDIRFKEYQARRVIETCGIVTIEKKGNVIADRVTCGGLVVRGKLKGAVVSRGPVLVGPEAEIKGDLNAPTIAVGAGAVLSGFYEVGQDPPPEPGK
ncbi:MAG TPA: polymer-forming cytoskeletal protein [Tepidisphaeraceae bacterium]|jgi:hypothetical protein|nr:polymer-forming cytoskeletal protein [Tepidisphaeraceae bacterium]